MRTASRLHRTPVLRVTKRQAASSALLLMLCGAGTNIGLLPAANAQPGNTQLGQNQTGFPPSAQQGNRPQVPGLNSGSSEDSSPFSKSAEERQVIARNDERQKRLVADTDKLLALATQLHEDVAKTNKNVLSMDVIRRSQEIEKLAHDIKERMKG